MYPLINSIISKSCNCHFIDNAMVESTNVSWFEEHSLRDHVGTGIPLDGKLLTNLNPEPLKSCTHTFDEYPLVLNWIESVAMFSKHHNDKKCLAIT